MAPRAWPWVTAALAVALAGCTTRALPVRYPAASAASPEAAAARPAGVTTALDSDPPLPGEPLGRWFGLRPGPAAPPPKPAGDRHDH